jgi:hypothetical protein
MKYNQPFGISDPNASYINGDPSTGTMGSIPPAASIEYPQREIVNLIADTGRAPDNAQLHQLGQSIQSGLLNYKQDTGTANAYAANLSPAPTGYLAGLFAVLRIANTNTGPSVLNLNSMGNKNIVRSDGSPAIAGDIQQNVLMCFMYDGTNFQMVWNYKVAGGGQIFLLANTDYYVNDSIGNDTYNGLQATFTSGINGPWKTLQRASDHINQYNLNGFNITVHVADGTYAGVFLPRPAGNGSIIWIGNTTSPGNCIVSGNSRSMSAFYGFDISDQHARGFTVTSSVVNPNDPCSGFYISGGDAHMHLDRIRYGACIGPHIIAARRAFVSNYFSSSFEIFGSSLGGGPTGPAHVAAFQGGQFSTDPVARCSLLIANPVNLVNFVYCAELGLCHLPFSTITNPGNVTAKKYDIYTNSIVNVYGGGVNYLPGNVAGTISTGGQYL